jgi:hypothetical protein
MRKLITNKYFEYPQDKEIVENLNIVNDTERLLTIEIPESDLEKIKDFEEQVFNNMKTYGSHHYRIFETLMEQKEQEKFLRNKYSSVQKAFEQYSMMLALAKSGEL